MYDKDYVFNEEEIDLVTDNFNDYLERYMDSGYSIYAVEKLMNLYGRCYRMTGDYSYYFDLISFIKNDTVGGKKEKSELLNYISRRIMYSFEDNKSLIESDEELEQSVSIIEMDEELSSKIKIGLANNAFDNDELLVALKYYEEINYKYLNYTAERRLKIIYSLFTYIGDTDKESLFKAASILKETREKSLAIRYYEKLEKLDLNDEEFSKLYMHKAYCYRKNRDFDEMFLAHEKIANDYANTELADDALAETGVYYLLYEKDTATAREIFNKVIEKYPNRNAVDNAYNWIAWSYLQDKNYPKALEAYEELRTKFPEYDYGINAIRNIKKIRDVFLK